MKPLKFGLRFYLISITIGFALCSCGGGTMGTGLSYGSGARGGKVAKLNVIDISGKVLGSNGSPLANATVTVQTPRSSYEVQTDSNGDFSTSATYSSGETVSFKVEASDVKGVYVDRDPPTNSSYGQITITALGGDKVTSSGIK